MPPGNKVSCRYNLPGMPARIINIAAAMVCAGIAAGIFAILADRGFDDSYITFAYSANLARGAGFVFNVGERVLSTTTPLFALLMTLPAVLGLSVPLASTGLGALALATGAWALWRLGWRAQTPWAGAAAGLIWMLHPWSLMPLSNEMPLYVALTLWALERALAQRWAMAMTCAGLATLTRNDGVLCIALVTALWWLAQPKRMSLAILPAAMRAFVPPLLLTLGPWLLFATLYFGAPWPVTLAAKRAQGIMAISSTFASRLPGYIDFYLRQPWHMLHVPLAVVGAGAIALAWLRAGRMRVWVWPALWSTLFVLAYWLLRVSDYFWYLAPIAPVLAVLPACGVQLVHDVVRRNLHGRASFLPAALAVVLTLLLVIGPIQSALGLARFNDNRLGLYRASGEWLRANTPPNSSIGTLEVGIIGFYAQRRVIDFAGLLQPDVTQQIRRESTYDDLALYAWNTYSPDYLAILDGMFGGIRETARFKAACVEVARIKDPAHPATLVIHRCTPP